MVGVGGRDLFDVFYRSSHDGSPRMLGVESEEAVVVPKAHQGDGRKVFNFIRRAGPYCGSHGGEIPAKEVFPIATLLDVFSESEVGFLIFLEFGDSFFIEAVDLEKHFPETRSEEVFSLCEEVVETASVKFQVISTVLDAEGHRGGLGDNVEFFKKAGEERVSDFIVYHEARVEWVLACHHGV